MHATQTINIGIISSPAMASTHGTGVQLQRIFAEASPGSFHLYWSRASGTSEYERSYLLEDRFEWPWVRGRAFAGRLLNRSGFTWWRGDQVHPGWFDATRREHHLECDACYVVVESESAATRALSLIERLGRPYVVHLMDLRHEEGLVPGRMPGYRHLLGGAWAVLALNRAIEREAAKFSCRHLEVVPFGRAIPAEVASPPDPDGELRLVMAGNLGHVGGLVTLAEAWPVLSERFPGLKLVYFGWERYLEKLPPALRPVLDYRGYLDAAACDSVLASSHLAYLPGPGALDCYGLYSLPSRMADYMMFGLPVIAHTREGTATDTFLRPLQAHVRCPRNPAQFARAVEGFLDKGAWERASAEARAFAHSHFDIETVRGRIFTLLAEASRSVLGVPAPPLPG